MRKTLDERCYWNLSLYGEAFIEVSGWIIPKLRFHFQRRFCLILCLRPWATYSPLSSYMNLLPQVYTQAHRQYRIDMKLFYLEAPWGDPKTWTTVTRWSWYILWGHWLGGLDWQGSVNHLQYRLSIGHLQNRRWPDGFRDFLGMLTNLRPWNEI